jgi:hypothetical protein
MPSAAENRGPAVSFLHQEDAIALSKQLVKTFGGQLEVEKTPDVETTIWFTLTLEKQPPKVFSDLSPRAVSREHEYSLRATISLCRMKMFSDGDSRVIAFLVTLTPGQC